MKMYLVGGSVRDELLGQKSKDLDYAVVLDPSEYSGDPFSYMVSQLTSAKYKIFLESPEYFTVRAQTPDRSEVADFVLARKESSYSDGRRPDSVEVGTLLDDLGRRDFSMNAIAKAADGSLIDPFNGQQAISERVIYAVGNAEDRIREDALRALRAIRFAVTKRMLIGSELLMVLNSPWLPSLMESVSLERQREELLKAFASNTIKTLEYLTHYVSPGLTDYLFRNGLWLKPTLEKP